MNKKLAAALQQHGMTVTGNSAYGTVQGYEMSLRAPSPMEQSAYFLHVSFYASEEKKQEAANEIARFGNKLRVENSAYGLTITLPQPVFTLNPLIEAIGRPNLKMTVDVGNFLCVDEDPEVAAMNNIRFASMVHFKDFHIRRNPPCKDGYIPTAHGRFIRGAITGDGDVNLAAIVKIIKNADYDGFLSIEYEGWEECKSACDRAMKNVLALVENN